MVREQTDVTLSLSILDRQEYSRSMEENLLNELENFASIKYLDNVTNNSSTNNCCSDDDQVRCNHFHHSSSNTFVFLCLGQFSLPTISHQRSTISFSGKMWQSFIGTERRTRTSIRNFQSRFSTTNRCKRKNNNKSKKYLNIFFID